MIRISVILQGTQWYSLINALENQSEAGVRSSSPSLTRRTLQISADEGDGDLWLRIRQH